VPHSSSKKQIRREIRRDNAKNRWANWRDELYFTRQKPEKVTWKFWKNGK